MASEDFALLAARVAALEAKSIGVRDLPMRQLQDKLELDWQPNASLLLSANSITPEMLAATLRFGTDVVTYPGGAQQSNTTVVSHGLPRVPLAVLLTLTGAVPNHLFSLTAAPTSTTFSVASATRDESVPAAATQRSFYWLAIG